MPSVVGSLNVGSSSGQMNFGDVLNMCPKDSSKTTQGQGGNSTGNIVNEVNGTSPTNTWNVVNKDQPMLGNL